jgi:hypothetical protein
MTKKKIRYEVGSGNVFADLGLPHHNQRAGALLIVVCFFQNGGFAVRQRSTGSWCKEPRK